MTEVSAIPPARSVPAASDERASKKAHEFEAVFLGQMTKLMMDSVQQDSNFSGGHGEEMFRGVMAEQIGNVIANGRGIGLSRDVMAEIVRLQRGNQP